MKNQTFACVLASVLLFSCLSNTDTSNKETLIKEESTNNVLSSTFPQVQFAIKQIQKAEETLHIQTNVSFELDTQNLGFEAYQILVLGEKVVVKGGDANGLMYGGFEVAEQLTLNKVVIPTKAEPHIQKRGIKFNIPLDVRTPSYDDTGDAAQKNYAHMWEWDFWEKYLDDLAVNRYNVLSLWNPHPFPSMVKLPNFPDVALDDVYITTLKPIGVESEWAEPQMVSSNVVEHSTLIKKMSIDQKIAFWQKVMRHASDRGIDIYFFTWNISANGAANPMPPYYRTYKQPLWDEPPGKHGINNQMDNPINVAYYRESVKTFLETYPDVKGIGVTAGEHMIDEAGGYKREQWIWETYGLGMKDVLKQQPERDVKFIHRVWNTDMDKIMLYWKDYPGSFEVSFKYAKARLYSTPYLNFANGHIKTMKKYDLKSWWNLRNDDIFVHRWGDADYVRDFIGHFKEDETAGYYMGSDGYVWGKEFISKNPALAGELENDKHWFNFMLWGRLGYDQSLSEDFFIKKLHQHFPATNAKLLYSGWQSASKIIPLVNVFHWQDWDFQWAVEAGFDARNGFHNVEMFMTNPTIPGGNYINPESYATNSNNKPNAITPYQVAALLEQYADETIAASKQLIRAKNDAELSTLLDDMQAMAWLGRYYAIKIKAATELALYQANGNIEHKNKAVLLLKSAVPLWDKYRQISEKNYKPQMLARTRMLDWSEILKHVKEDVQLAETIVTATVP